MKRSSKRLKSAPYLDDPIAIAVATGSILFNASFLGATLDEDPLAVARRLQAEGAQVFVGVAVPQRHRLRRALDADLSDATADTLARFGGRLVRRRGRR